MLACLSDTDGEMVTRLAEFALMEQSRLTRIIERMEEKGWVRRAADTEDRRRVRVHLTEAGRALATRLVQEARAHEAALLGALEGSDAARIKRALKSLLARLDSPEGRAALGELTPK